MNKRRVDSWLLKAREGLMLAGVVEDGTVDRTYRAQIVSFGAAVLMTTLPAAVTFFAGQGNASVNRSRLLQAMYYCISGELLPEKEIASRVCENDSNSLREQFIDASVAVKLAMNFFELVQRGGSSEES